MGGCGWVRKGGVSAGACGWVLVSAGDCKSVWVGVGACKSVWECAGEEPYRLSRGAANRSYD